jgi:hypothetical protein
MDRCWISDCIICLVRGYEQHEACHYILRCAGLLHRPPFECPTISRLGCASTWPVITPRRRIGGVTV